jgi:ArsR family transcriptional regulator
MTEPMSPAQAALLFKMLADEPRLRILLLLAARDEMNVTALCAMLGLQQPAVSHHLTLLRMSQLVTRRRQGKSNYYSLASERVRHLLQGVKA